MAGLLGLVLFAPWRWLQFGALVGLAGAGVLFLYGAERLVAQYSADLSTGARGGPMSGVLRAELGTTVDLERPLVSPRSRSPHSRRRALSAPVERDRPRDAGALADA